MDDALEVKTMFADDATLARIAQIESDLNRERLVSHNLGKMVDSQADKIVEIEDHAEKLQAHVAMLRGAINGLVESNYDAGFQAADDALSATEQDVAKFIADIEAKALEKIADSLEDLSDLPNKTYKYIDSLKLRKMAAEKRVK